MILQNTRFKARVTKTSLVFVLFYLRSSFQHLDVVQVALWDVMVIEVSIIDLNLVNLRIVRTTYYT